MPIKEVCSPISSHSTLRGHTPGSNPPIGPGARSNPSRDRSNDSVPPQPSHVSSGSGKEPDRSLNPMK
jgi:hypothetical protein